MQKKSRLQKHYTRSKVRQKGGVIKTALIDFVRPMLIRNVSEINEIDLGN